ncbi:hypothetical protein D3C71_1818380 [compost metagenome]
MDVYLFYGIKNSLLSDNNQVTLARSNKVVSLIGLALAALLVVVAFIHHSITNGTDTGLYYFSLIYAAIHLAIYAYRLSTSKNVTAKIK